MSNPHQPLFGDEFGEKDRGICNVCGEWNCKIHANIPSFPHSSAGFSNPFLMRIALPITEKLWKKIEEGKAVIINTGEQDTFKEVTKEELDKMAPPPTEEDDEEEEFSSAGAGGVGSSEDSDWDLPEAMEVKLGLAGMNYIYAKMEDKEVAEREDDEPGPKWYDHVKDESLIATNGSCHTVRMYRAKKDPERLKIIKETAKNLIPKFKRHLVLAFEAEARKARERGLRHGAIDAGRAHNLISAKKGDIFAKKAHRKEIATAITIVLDDSGSMQASPGRGYGYGTGAYEDLVGKELLWSKAGCAATLAYVLGEICKQLNVSFEVVSYQKDIRWWSDHYSVQYKAFHEHWDAVKDRLGSYIPMAGTDVPYEAATFAAKRLLQRKEERRIMFFLTDGCDSNIGVDRLGELANELYRKANVRMVGVSILTDSLKKFMKEKAEAVLKIEDLNEAVFSRLAKIVHSF